MSQQEKEKAFWEAFNDPHSLCLAIFVGPEGDNTTRVARVPKPAVAKIMTLCDCAIITLTDGSSIRCPMYLEGDTIEEHAPLHRERLLNHRQIKTKLIDDPNTVQHDPLGLGRSWK